MKTITRFACAYYIKLLKLNREKHNRCIETKRNKRKRKSTTERQKDRKKENRGLKER